MTRSDLDAVEARYFTTCLATDRKPATCAACGRLLAACACTTEELVTWLEAHPSSSQPVSPGPRRCSRG